MHTIDPFPLIKFFPSFFPLKIPGRVQSGIDGGGTATISFTDVEISR
ncbi:MAG: hypothetical protein HCAMLNBO_02472 [Candidatus Brocadia fulgida]|nr:hypothetical protein [Candidatus Brocadia fulgida]